VVPSPPLVLHDTRRRGRHPFHPGATVRLYVCGITPYDSAHLGHAFVYTVFDVLVRHLEARGHRVVYARNVTDVDDDILRTARQRGVNVDVLARTEAARLEANLRRLGLREPDVVPYVSEAVPDMLPLVAGLLGQGLAYALPDGRVYADTAAMPGFLAFSGLDREQALQQFAEKGGDPDAEGKRDPLDFLLWQPSLPDEPSWPAPWGAGRPGWHLECSVMAMQHLGATIDVHGGGSDLVFPHHEAEVLQSEGLTGQAPFARFWLHVGMVGLEGTKMSKSLGNLVFLGDLLDRVPADAVRHLLLRHHYRSAWDYEEAQLEHSVATVARWRAVAASADPAAPDGVLARVRARLDDDLDTPGALAVLDEAAAAGDGAGVAAGAAHLGFRLR
jgi:L-cysteine:1D-myo-inositol 2-amino-2-deoxy-alpha-D-glucopyranoside ligase